ncbi:hypothetical protein HK57_00148 [Aspergillus ustus]|uniref:Rhodopsin domain-containing protein n=1 Tax=Aspergillus ustus TaxID=40382 RepID=A0A0C1C2W3_ASPUT|nr:hypothetical protein HK57_00148 [Aspergillus ustus]
MTEVGAFANCREISTSVLFGLASVSVVTRTIIRISQRRLRPAIDDVLVLVAYGFLLATFVIIYVKVINPMYWRPSPDLPPLELAARIMNTTYTLHVWTFVAMTTATCSLGAVKFSFLWFFKKMIDRIRAWEIYWWAVMLYTLATLVYAVTLPFTGCPFFYNPRVVECSAGSRKKLILNQAIVYYALDITSDILILAIPVGIIRKIRVRPSQKVVLAISLCLTVVIIALGIVQLAGLIYNGAVDSIWSAYWQFVITEVGVILAAAVAFRSFFVTRSKPLIAGFSANGRQKMSGRLNMSTAGRSWYRNQGVSMDSTVDVEEVELTGSQSRTSNSTEVDSQYRSADSLMQAGRGAQAAATSLSRASAHSLPAAHVV